MLTAMKPILWISVVLAICCYSANSLKTEKDGDSLERRLLWNSGAFNKKMEALRAKMKDLQKNLKNKLKDIAAKTANISTQHINMGSNSNSQEIWAGHGSIIVVNSQGHFVSSSMNTNRIGADVPATAIDLTANIDEATCTDLTVLTSVKITMCGGNGRCKSLRTSSSTATICPGSIRISTGTGGRIFIGNGGSIINGAGSSVIIG